jgi:hypothetical protein
MAMEFQILNEEPEEGKAAHKKQLNKCHSDMEKLDKHFKSPVDPEKERDDLTERTQPSHKNEFKFSNSTLVMSQEDPPAYYGTRFIISLITFAANISFSVVAPFFPLEMEKQGYDVYYMGSIMSIFSISNLASTFAMPYLLTIMTKR